MGPLTTMRGVEKFERQVSDALKLGASLLLGSGKAYNGRDLAKGPGEDGGGYFLDPIILSNMNEEMIISREETFGPVCALYKFDTEDQAVQWAYGTSMGLASYVLSENVNLLWRVFEKLEAGVVGLNTGSSSAAETPFGRIKESGLCKEAGKDVGVRGYLIIRSGALTIQGHY